MIAPQARADDMAGDVTLLRLGRIGRPRDGRWSGGPPGIAPVARARSISFGMAPPRPVRPARPRPAPPERQVYHFRLIHCSPRPWAASMARRGRPQWSCSFILREIHGGRSAVGAFPKMLGARFLGASKGIPPSVRGKYRDACRVAAGGGIPPRWRENFLPHSGQASIALWYRQSSILTRLPIKVIYIGV